MTDTALVRRALYTSWPYRLVELDDILPRRDGIIMIDERDGGLDFTTDPLPRATRIRLDVVPLRLTAGGYLVCYTCVSPASDHLCFAAAAVFMGTGVRPMSITGNMHYWIPIT